MSHANARFGAEPAAASTGIFAKLHNVKIGGSKSKVKRRDLIFILSNLSTLLDNGVPLPKALATLGRERALRRHAPMLDAIRRKVESGQAFSGALATFPETFDELMVNQIKVGERSGTVPKTLKRITEQLEQASQLWGKILKRLSYPMIVVVAGAGVVTFMLLFVVPTFEETYNKAHLSLPGPTKLLIGVGDLTTSYGWLLPIGAFAAVIGLTRMRRNPLLAYQIDRVVMKVPLLGSWLRDMAVLQFMDVLGTMMESGFKLVDALSVSVNSIGNHAVRRAVEDLRAAILRGERLSHEIEQMGETFPPVVSQLVIVGEQTGNMAKATKHIRQHLRREIERKVEIAVGTIEPILTIGMAVAIGAILLAIYMPMFGMIDAIDT